MKTGTNWANADGPKPGSTKAISQRKAISMGYEAPKSERRVDVFQKEHETGVTHAPGLTTRAERHRM